MCFLDDDQADEWLRANGWERSGHFLAYRGGARQVRISIPGFYPKAVYLIEVLFSMWEGAFPGALLLLLEYDLENTESLTHFIWEALCRGRDPLAPGLAYWADYIEPQDGGGGKRFVGEPHQKNMHQLFTAREAGFAKAFFLLAALSLWRALVAPPGREFFLFSKCEDIYFVSQRSDLVAELCGWLQKANIVFVEAPAREYFLLPARPPL